MVSPNNIIQLIFDVVFHRAGCLSWASDDGGVGGGDSGGNEVDDASVDYDTIQLRMLNWGLLVCHSCL